MEWDMVDRIDDEMDLDLNLGHVSPASLVAEEAVNSDDLAADEPPLHGLADSMFRAAIQRVRSGSLLWLDDPPDGPVGGPSADVLGAEDGGGEEVAKTCENHVSLVDKESSGEGECAEKKTIDEYGSFFDCNICLDLAQEPVVTCCGHLFCWRCIYNWIHVHSDAKECPVCKGEVTDKTLIPIYGRGNHAYNTGENSGEEIPDRPSAKRVESIRQTIQRAASSFTLEEIVRHVGSRFDDVFQLPSDNDGNPGSTRDRLLRSRAIRRELELNRAVMPETVMDLTQDSPETSRQRRLSALSYRRLWSYAVQSSEQPPPSGDDRDSFSSIAAVIHGETISTSSSSRRRNEASRGSDVDSGESRALRRRRFV